MAEQKIRRRDLWARLSSIKRKETWIGAVQDIGLRVTQPKGGSSHHAIRLPGFDDYDVRGLIGNVYDPVRKDMSEAIFKSLVRKGNIPEDKIWVALGMLKKDE